jgi:hypothetical protein
MTVEQHEHTKNDCSEGGSSTMKTSPSLGIWESLSPGREDILVLASPQPNRKAPFAANGEGEEEGGGGDDRFSIITRASSAASTHITAFSIISAAGAEGPSSPAALVANGPLTYNRIILHWSLESVIRPDSPASMYRYRKYLSRTKARQLAQHHDHDDEQLRCSPSCMEEAYTSLGHSHNIFPQFYDLGGAIMEEDEGIFLDDAAEEAVDGEAASTPVSPILAVVSKTIRLPVVLASNMICFILNQIQATSTSAMDSAPPPA